RRRRGRPRRPDRADEPAPGVEHLMADLVIDSDRCSGHGRCYTLAPELVQPDDEGFPVLVEGAVADGEAAQLVVRSCPEQAISQRVHA
ncbi:MAG: ferredoxin, partial [Mycobacteriales bacterium]